VGGVVRVNNVVQRQQRTVPDEPRAAQRRGINSATTSTIHPLYDDGLRETHAR